jgi:hypothetical protein
MRDVAIVGLPASGKTTVFDAVARAHAPPGEHREHLAMVPVPDARVEKLAELYGSAKTSHAQLRLHDVPGLDAHALARIREAHVLAVVLRAFGAEADPVQELDTFRTELAVADLGTVDKISERVHKQARVGASQAKLEAAVCERAEMALSEGRWLADESWTSEELRVVSLWTPLTIKPLLHVVNADDEGNGAQVPDPSVVVRGKLEAEAADLPEEEAEALLAEFGVDEPALRRFVRAVYEALGLVTFFTANEHEAHAWAVPRATKAPQAAGAVHSDFEHGFIRAERVGFDELVEAGSPEVAKQKGLVRVEGKDYEVREGDVLFIRHS